MAKRDWVLDFDDHRTSRIEKVLAWVLAICVIVSTGAEVIQALQAWQVLR